MGTTFKDNAGRTWTVAINVAAVKRVRAMLKIDLVSVLDKKLQVLGEIVGDPVQLVDVLYVLCKDEADKLGMSDEDFGRGMASDYVLEARDAFIEALINFFPNAKAMESLRKILKLSKQQLQKKTEKQEKEIEEQLAKIENQLQSESGKSSTESQVDAA